MEHLSWWQVLLAINEQFDKILLSKLLPADIAEAEVGVYSLL
jgi:hypothetical protein